MIRHGENVVLSIKQKLGIFPLMLLGVNRCIDGQNDHMSSTPKLRNYVYNWQQYASAIAFFSYTLEFQFLNFAKKTLFKLVEYFKL